VTLAASDPDGDSLTYSSTDGTVVGNKLTYAAPADGAGTKVLAYKVTDSKGASTNGSVTVTVTKASSTTKLTVRPGKITTKSRHIRGKVAVTSTGAVPGGTVDLYDGDTKIGTGVLDASGNVKIAVTKKLSKGKHTIKAVFAGTDSTATSQASVIVKVKNKK
jgi:Bacterial Ig-like domain (group 3)/Bacterial Ig domain